MTDTATVALQEFNSNALFIDRKGDIKTLQELFPNGISKPPRNQCQDCGISLIPWWVYLIMTAIVGIGTIILMIMNSGVFLWFLLILVFLGCGGCTVYGYSQVSSSDIKRQIRRITNDQKERVALYFDHEKSSLQKIKFSIDYGVSMENIDIKEMESRMHEGVVNILQEESICKFNRIFRIGYSYIDLNDRDAKDSSGRYYFSLIYYRVSSGSEHSFEMCHTNFTGRHKHQYKKLCNIVKNNMDRKYSKNIKQAGIMNVSKDEVEWKPYFRYDRPLSEILFAPVVAVDV